MKKLSLLFFMIMTLLLVSCHYKEEIHFDPESKYIEHHNAYKTYTWKEVKDSSGKVISKTKKWHYHSEKFYYYVSGTATYEIAEYEKQPDGSKLRRVIETQKQQETRKLDKADYDQVIYCVELPVKEVKHQSNVYGR